MNAPYMYSSLPVEESVVRERIRAAGGTLLRDLYPWCVRAVGIALVVTFATAAGLTTVLAFMRTASRLVPQLEARP